MTITIPTKLFALAAILLLALAATGCDEPIICLTPPGIGAPICVPIPKDDRPGGQGWRDEAAAAFGVTRQEVDSFVAQFESANGLNGANGAGGKGQGR